MKTASVIERRIPSRTKLFDIHPLFQQDRINLLDQELFPKGNNVNLKKYPFAVFHNIINPYMDNEVRGFIQHLALDEQYAAATIYEYITCFSHSISDFMNSNHPEIDSIADIDFEDIYCEYIEFLNDKGVVTVSHSVIHVTEDMEWKSYPAKTNHLVGFVKFYRYVCSVRFIDDENEYDKDVWDVRRLGIPFSTAVSRPRYTVNYKKISQPWLKVAAKEYNYYRIQNRTMSAVLDDMKAINRFSEFLQVHCPSITGLDELDRGIIEGYYTFLSQFGYAASAYNRRISGIRTFLTIGSMLEINRFPTKPLIMYSDYHIQTFGVGLTAWLPSFSCSMIWS